MPRPPEPPNSPAAYGERCHLITEAWGQVGAAAILEECPEVRTVRSVVPYLPEPGAAMHEHRVTARLGGVLWDMRLDWIDGYVPGAFVSLGDLKTTGNFQYVKTVEQLEDDHQAVCYGHWGAERFDVPTAIGRWVYGLRVSKKKVPPPGRVVAWSMSRDELRAKFKRRAELAHVLAWARLRDRDPESFPRKLGEPCRRVGGCEYRTECHRGLSALDHAAAALYTLKAER